MEELKKRIEELEKALEEMEKSRDSWIKEYSILKLRFDRFKDMIKGIVALVG